MAPPVEGIVDKHAQASSAVRQIEQWYRLLIDDFVREGQERSTDGPDGRPGPITGPVIAYAHEQAWRHAVVRAARASEPRDWAAMTVAHEAAAYEHLLGWSASTYTVDEGEVRASQTSKGYRHHPR